MIEWLQKLEKLHPEKRAGSDSAFALWVNAQIEDNERDSKKYSKKILDTLLRYWKEKNWKLKSIDNIIKEIK